jgi:hypothetical protein
LALAVAAMHVAQILARPPIRPVVWTPLAIASIGSIAWIALWLAITTATPAWLAVISAVTLTSAIVVAMLACSRPVTAAARPARPDDRPPRKLRAQHRRARERLLEHTRNWNEVAHRYGSVVTGSGSQAEDALACLLSDEKDPSLSGIDPYDALILAALRTYRPGPLARGLDAAAWRLDGERLPTPGRALPA